MGRKKHTQRTLGCGADFSEPIERVVFFGTPKFAVPTLDALHRSGRTPELVVSQPTRGSGRGRRAVPPPVALWAQEHGVDLVQTDNVKDPEFLEMLREREPSLAIVVAFGQIFRKELLALPRFGCMNLHASLLPAYRGASPIVAAIRNGEVRAGVSTMVMERGLDSGPILLQASLTVGENETALELSPRLSELGGETVVKTLECFEAGELQSTPQDHDAASHAPMLERSEGDLDWNSSAKELHNLVRAFVPWPGTRTTFRDLPVAIKKTVLEHGGREKAAGSTSQVEPACGADARPGEVLGLRDGVLWVAAGDECSLGILELQRPGRRALSARDFCNGEQPKLGESFGTRAETSSAGEAEKRVETVGRRGEIVDG